MYSTAHKYKLSDTLMLAFCYCNVQLHNTVYPNSSLKHQYEMTS